jgi:hypothetical protein
MKLRYMGQGSVIVNHANILLQYVLLLKLG